jgi:hypothetical protein
VSWEFSMSRLRRCELHREEWVALWKSVRFEGSESPAATRAGEKYAHNERGFLIDQKPRHRAIRALWRALTGGTKSYSWTFPAHTTALFGWITIGFFAVGTIFVLAALRPATLLDMRLSVPSTSAEFLVSGWLITLVIHTFVWYLFGLRMHSVLYGSATVNAYAWRFLPIRAAYLNALNVEPSYVGLEVPPPAR